MAQIAGAIVINRPVEEVFDFVADERNESKYNPKMLRAEQMTPGSIGRHTVSGRKRQQGPPGRDGHRIDLLRAAPAPRLHDALGEDGYPRRADL